MYLLPVNFINRSSHNTSKAIHNQGNGIHAFNSTTRRQPHFNLHNPHRRHRHNQHQLRRPRAAAE